MFKKNANTTFNNGVFNSAMIRAMKKDRQIHDQMQRLYLAAKFLRRVEEKADVARLLNVSYQNLDAWEKRGISEGGLIDAQAIIGCDAIWLRDGIGDMVRGTPISQGLTAAEIGKLSSFYEQSDAEGRKSIMQMAEAMAQTSLSRAAPRNQPK